jgi:hypothetical protein
LPLAVSLVAIVRIATMAMNSETPKAAGSGGELEKRVTAVETGLGVIAKTMVTAEVLQRELGIARVETSKEFAAVRDEMNRESRALRAEIGVLRVEVAKVPLETVKWLLAVLGIAAAVATSIYNIWFR